MPEQSSCWFCHRTEAEVSAFTDVETAREREIREQMSQVIRFKADFDQAADAWRKGVPKEFKEFDFEFMTSHPDQFKSIRIGNGLLGEIAAPNKLLSEIAESKKLTFDWLGDVANVLRKGDGEIHGFGAFSPLERADRDLLRKMLDQFEAKWRRRLGGDGGKGTNPSGYNQGFEGLKLFDGLEYMIAVGVLYYDVQAHLLEMAKRKEINSKPKKGISVLVLKGYPPVPLCSVCVDVVRELGPRQLQAEPAVLHQVAAAPSVRS
jgi:hypothetical protein